MEEYSHDFRITGTKALIGAAFIQYLFYGFMYIIEGVKLREYEGDEIHGKASTKSTITKNV